MAIKCHSTSGNNDSGSYEINIAYYGGESSEEWIVWKDKLLKVLDDQGIILGLQRYMFTERLSTGAAKATFDQAYLNSSIRIIDNFNKVLTKMTKHEFPA